MATGVSSWSTTAGTNATADSAVLWSEGQAPSTVNDSARGMMASVAKFRDDISGGLTTGGSSTAYTVTTNQAFASLAALGNRILTVIPHTTSGAAPTLAVDGLPAKAINVSTGVVTVQTSGTNTVLAQAANTVAIYTYACNAGTGVASWNITYYAPITCIPLVVMQVPANSGTNGTAAGTNLLNTTIVPGLKADSSGNPCLELAPGWSLMVNSNAAILSSGKVCTVNVVCGENF